MGAAIFESLQLELIKRVIVNLIACLHMEYLSRLLIQLQTHKSCVIGNYNHSCLRHSCDNFRYHTPIRLLIVHYLFVCRSRTVGETGRVQGEAGRVLGETERVLGETGRLLGETKRLLGETGRVLG